MAVGFQQLQTSGKQDPIAAAHLEARVRQRPVRCKCEGYPRCRQHTHSPLLLPLLPLSRYCRPRYCRTTANHHQLPAHGVGRDGSDQALEGAHLADI